MGAMKKIENMEKNLENLSPDMFTFAEYDANAAERTGYSNYSYWASTWRVFTKNKVAMFFLTLLIAAAAFFAVYGIGLLVTKEPLMEEILGQTLRKLTGRKKGTE